MAPPSYSDLGKAARDVFSKGFNWGFFKLVAKTKAQSNVEFKASLSSNRDTGKVSGSLETKYYGITFTEKWNTDNVLNAEIKIEDQIAEGLELTFDTSFAPQTGKNCGKIKTAYKMDYVHWNCDMDLDFAWPTIHGAAVLVYEVWLARYHVSFDTSKSKFTRSNFGFGFNGGDFAFTTHVNDGEEFVGSGHQKVSDNLEPAVNLSCVAGTGCSTLAVGGKYKLGNDASISAKVNNSSRVGIDYTQTLRDGVKMTISALIDGKNILTKEAIRLAWD